MSCFCKIKTLKHVKAVISFDIRCYNTFLFYLFISQVKQSHGQLVFDSGSGNIAEMSALEKMQRDQRKLLKALQTVNKRFLDK